ncbi:MAG TPA: pitrilysin family protein [Cytophagales bacterium]|nr:pitrilysin family protein [Cytophagales bacterium]
MRRFLLLLSLSLFSLFVAEAQKNLPSNFFLTKLDNGLEVLVIEDKTVPLATVEICVKNGSYTESPEFNGLSHLYEHMFFKANKDLPSQEAFLNRVKELGVVFNGTTSEERVNYFFTLSNEKLKEGIQFMNSAIRYPLFLQEEMKNENPVVDGEFQRNESNPVFFLVDKMKHELWGDLYSRKNVIGDHDVILTATPEKMKIIQSKYYYPNNSILVVAGDVKHDEVTKLAKEIFGDWKGSDFDPFEKWPIPEFKPLTEDKTFIVENANSTTPIIIKALHGPDTRNDLQATYAADVFSFILGQQSSQLQKDLVDSGLAYQVSVSYQTNKHTGPIIIFMVPNPAKMKEAILKLEEHIKKWDTDDYFTDEQLQTSKTLLAIDDIKNRDAASNYIHTVTYWWASANLDYYVNYVENLNNVTREDIKNYVQKYIQNKPSVNGLLISPTLKQELKIQDFQSLTK